VAGERTWRSLFDEWTTTSEFQSLRKTRANKIRRDVARDFLPLLGTHAVCDFGPKDASDLYQRMGGHLAIRTVRNRLDHFRAFVRYARQRGLFAGNPETIFADLKPVIAARRRNERRRDRRADRALTVKQRNCVLDYFRTARYLVSPGRLRNDGTHSDQGREHYDFFAFVWLLAFTGMRPSEACAANREDVNVKAGTLRVKASYVEGALANPKTESAFRDVALDRETLSVLRKLLALRDTPMTAPLFVGLTGARVDRNMFTHTHWRRALKACKASGEGRGVYSLKHTYCTSILKTTPRGELEHALHFLEVQTGVDVDTLRAHYIETPTANPDDAERYAERTRQRLTHATEAA
jgi:integrase